MSQHTIEIIEVGEPHVHPNADALEVLYVWGWQCVTRKGEFHEGDKACYIPPDFIVDVSRPEFAFLKQGNRTHARIAVKKLRGQISQGLLIKVPAALAELPVGTNVIEQLGITRYEPPMKGVSTFGNYVKEPFGLNSPSGLYAPKFDVDSWQRYGKVLFDIRGNDPADNVFPWNERGENVIITEKLHGANARYVYAKNPETGEYQQYCGSRTNWMAEDWRNDIDHQHCNVWWRALDQCLQIGDMCKAFPEYVFYGECFGAVQNLHYSAGKGQVFFAAFACMGPDRKWLDYDDLMLRCLTWRVPMVPQLYRGPLNEKLAYELAEGDSSWPGANHMREGVVIVPEHERVDPRLGRVCLKIVSNRYLLS